MCITGNYQCFATNELGTATANSVFVRKSTLHNFKDRPPKVKTVTEGDALAMPCSPPDGYPKPKVFWLIEVSVPSLKIVYKAGYTLSVVCGTLTEHTLVKCKTTSSIHEIVI